MSGSSDLGYVGLPLAVAFCEAGHDVIGVDVDPRKVGALKARGELHRGRARTSRFAAISERLSPTRRFAELSRCDAVIVARTHAADEEPRAGPQRAPGGHAARSRPCSSAASSIVVESTTYPGTTREQVVPLLEESGLDGRRRVQRGLLAGADRSRAHRLHHAKHPEGGRRATAVCQERAVALYEQVCDHVVPGLDTRGRRAHEAARERLPLGEHRARERARDALRPHGDRHLGGRERGFDQALRLHALRARPGHGRPLPARRSLLPLLARARVRLAHGFHRACRRGRTRRCLASAPRRSPAP